MLLPYQDMKRLLALLCCPLLAGSVLAQSTIYEVRVNEILANGTDATNAVGKAIDKIELYNTGANAVDLSGATLTDDSGILNAIPPRFVFPPESVIPGHGYFVVAFDPDITNNSFGLSASGDAVIFRDPQGNTIDEISFGNQPRGFSIGRFPDGTGAWTLTSPQIGSNNVAVQVGSQSALRINEWLAAQKDNTADPDFIELYNTSDTPIDLAGLSFVDASFKSHYMPPLSYIGVGNTSGFAVFDELAFGLGKDGDSITLVSFDFTVLDSVVFGPQTNDDSMGRLPDGSTNITFFPKRATPGRPNFGRIDSIAVNELLTHTDPPLEDAIELINLTDQPVDISGWYMSDDADNPRRFQFPSGSVIAPRGLFVLYEFQFRNSSTPNDYTFNSAHGGTVYITQTDPDGTLLATLEQKFGAAQNGVSFGRIVTNDDDKDLVALSCRSFGKDDPRTVLEFRQGTGASNSCPPLFGPVVISEVMYNPGGITENTNEEYIELRNVLPGADALLYDPQFRNPWKLSGSVQYQFAVGDKIPRGGYLLLVPFDPNDVTLRDAFTNNYNVPATVQLKGPFIGRLGSDETLELWRPDQPQGPTHPDAGYVPQILVDRVHYENQAPWPLGSNRTGTSLQRKNSPSYGDEPFSWEDNLPTAGRANVQPLLITSQPQSQAMLVGTTAEFTITLEGPEPQYQWHYKNKPLKGAPNASTLTVANVNRKNAGLYSVVVTNLGYRVVSSNAVLTAVSPVVIKTQPKTRTAKIGKSVPFKISATGTAPIQYQWWFNGAPIENATNAAFKIVSAQPEHSGTYTCTASNVLTGGVSLPAVLTVQ